LAGRCRVSRGATARCPNVRPAAGSLRCGRAACARDCGARGHDPPAPVTRVSQDGRVRRSRRPVESRAMRHVVGSVGLVVALAITLYVGIWGYKQRTGSTRVKLVSLAVVGVVFDLWGLASVLANDS